MPRHFATTMPWGLDAYGVVVESHEGRPNKIEGNDLHPSTAGRSNAFIQAAPADSLRPGSFANADPLRRSPATWEDFKTAWAEIAEQLGDGRWSGDPDRVLGLADQGAADHGNQCAIPQSHVGGLRVGQRRKHLPGDRAGQRQPRYGRCTISTRPGLSSHSTPTRCRPSPTTSATPRGTPSGRQRSKTPTLR